MENNKLIAEFMQLPSQGMGDGLHRLYEDPFSGEYTEDLKYHCSWDWLMPVVEKIENISCKRQTFTIDICAHHCQINGYGSIVNNDIIIHNDVITSKIDAIYLIVVNFIRWYNQQ